MAHRTARVVAQGMRRRGLGERERERGTGREREREEEGDDGEGEGERSGRIQHAPNYGYRFVWPSPPFPKGEFVLSRYWETPCFSGKSCSTESPARIHCFPYQEKTGGKNVTQNGGPQIDACLILSERERTERQTASQTHRETSCYGSSLMENSTG